jgi:hypothetical protein
MVKGGKLMEKFLLVYYGGAMAATPSEQKKSMAAWMKWFQDMGKAVVDGGAPTIPGKEISSAGTKNIALAKPVSGYSILQAENMDAAVKLAKSCPIIAGGGKIAVYSIMPMM